MSFIIDDFKRIKEVCLAADTLPEYGRKYGNPYGNDARIKRSVCELCGQSIKDIRMYHVGLKSISRTSKKPKKVIFSLNGREAVIVRMRADGVVEAVYVGK